MVGSLAETASASGAGYTLSSVSGLSYGASAGFRFDLDQDFFLDISADLFSSPLFQTTKSETVDGSGAKTSESESTTTSISLDSVGSSDDLTVAVGMKL